MCSPVNRHLGFLQWLSFWGPLLLGSHIVPSSTWLFKMHPDIILQSNLPI